MPRTCDPARSHQWHGPQGPWQWRSPDSPHRRETSRPITENPSPDAAHSIFGGVAVWWTFFSRTGQQARPSLPLSLSLRGRHVAYWQGGTNGGAAWSRGGPGVHPGVPTSGSKCVFLHEKFAPRGTPGRHFPVSSTQYHWISPMHTFVILSCEMSGRPSCGCGVRFVAVPPLPVAHALESLDHARWRNSSLPVCRRPAPADPRAMEQAAARAASATASGMNALEARQVRVRRTLRRLPFSCSGAVPFQWLTYLSLHVIPHHPFNLFPYMVPTHCLRCSTL